MTTPPTTPTPTPPTTYIPPMATSDTPATTTATTPSTPTTPWGEKWAAPAQLPSDYQSPSPSPSPRNHTPYDDDAASPQYNANAETKAETTPLLPQYRCRKRIPIWQRYGKWRQRPQATNLPSSSVSPLPPLLKTPLRHPSKALPIPFPNLTLSPMPLFPNQLFETFLI